MQKNEKLEEDEILFKAIEEEKIWIKAKHKVSANFASLKSDAKSQEKAIKAKKEFVKWPKFKKYCCKQLTDQECKHANKEYNKYYKKRHISRFYDSYISLNKKKTPEGPGISSSNLKKNISYITQVVANKMFKTGLT